MVHSQRSAPPLPHTAHPDSAQAHSEDALDEALAESFPASDPVAVDISTAIPKDGQDPPPP